MNDRLFSKIVSGRQLDRPRDHRTMRRIPRVAAIGSADHLLLAVDQLGIELGLRVVILALYLQFGSCVDQAE